MASFSIRILVGLSIFLSFSAHALDLALTFDDPMAEESEIMSYAEVNQRILDALEKNDLQAYLFVTGHRVDSDIGTRIVGMWDEAGHGIGDHTYSHPNFGSPGTTLKDFLKDIADNQVVLKRFRNRVPLFRFPFLHEGDTKEKRDGMRDYLIKKKLRNGYVTVDASDWAISSRLVKAQNRGSSAIGKYRDFYIQHILDRVHYYDTLAKKYFKRDIKHTLLLHHNVLNALFLGDLIQALKKKGIRLISAQEAYEDEAYLELPDIVPAGQSLVWAMAKAHGDTTLRYPGEDEKYEKKSMDSNAL